MRYVAAFRTYGWDDDIALLARHFFAACPSARHVVLADETRGPLGIEGYEVLGHTSDTSALGLVEHPKARSLWFNHDYGTYVLRQALPGYDAYVLSESDVAVNIDVEAMVGALQERSVDFLAHDIRPARSDWHWLSRGSELFAEPWQCLLFFCVFSPRAIDALYEGRRHLSERFLAGDIARWPFCELFVASRLREHRFRFAEASEFADTRHLRYRPRIDISNPIAWRPGSLVHSVIGRDAYLREAIAKCDPTHWFESGSGLRRLLDRYPLAEYAPLLRARFEAVGDAPQLTIFDEHVRRHAPRAP
jgi:hypothetical protein